MINSEKQLKKIIKKSLLNEGFFDNVKKMWNKVQDPTFHHQVSQLYQNSSDKFDSQFNQNPDNLPVMYGSGLNMEGFLKFIFVTDTQSAKGLIYVNHKYLYQHQNQELWAQDIHDLIKPQLIAYLGLVPSKLQNPIVQRRFETLLDCAIMQISSSTKYFAQGGGVKDPQAGYDNLITKIKPNLVEEFNTLIPTILRPAF